MKFFLWVLYVIAFFFIPFAFSVASVFLLDKMAPGFIVGLLLDALLFWAFVKYLRRQKEKSYS